MKFSFWRDEHAYLELGTTLSFRSDDEIFAVNESSIDEENAPSVNLVNRRNDSKKGLTNIKPISACCRRCSKLVLMFLGIFLLLFIPMLGLSIAAGINRRKVSHQDLKNLQDRSGIDEDTILDPEFVDKKDDSTVVPSKSPLSEELEIATLIPSPNPPDQPTLSHHQPASKPTIAPILMRLTMEPTLEQVMVDAPSIVYAPTGPTNLPTTESPTISRTHSPATLFETMKPLNTAILTLPLETESVLYIGVGNWDDIRIGGVDWKTDRLFQTDPTSVVTTLPCIDMGEQALRGLFCKVRSGSQRYEIIPPTKDTDAFAAVLYVYNDGASFSVLSQDKVVAHENRIGIYQVTTETFTLPDAAYDMISLKIQGDVALAGIVIVPQQTKTIKEDLPEHPAGDTSERLIPTYQPGQLTVEMMGLLLSEGLQVRLLATTGKPVEYADGSTSDIPFHDQPDAGATYALDDGGWIYVSNSEARPNRGDHDNRYPGGVGALTFSNDGEIRKYEMILTETRANCGGGRTPWGAWISGEEYNAGKIWQVDPTGTRKAQRITMGEVKPGLFESFSYDARDMSFPRFFMTKDDERGALRRFTPYKPDWSKPWEILTGKGDLDYLVLEPEDVTRALLGNDSSGAFYWETEYDVAAESAFNYYKMKMMYILNLDLGTYESRSTEDGLFNGQPDQIVRLFDDNIVDVDDTLVYFTEDGGRLAGVHARNVEGQFFTILESRRYRDETTGLSFSPDAKHLYVAYQDNGLLFDVTRSDGLPFYAKTLNVKYHNVDQ